MDLGEIYHFLFETYAGIGCLVGIGLLATLLVSIIMERKIRKKYKHREPKKDEWSLFGEDEDVSDSEDAPDADDDPDADDERKDS